ncbi:MAG: hypothetical protein OXS28_06790 [Gammaproteobacteria bacterium]|nr:hypothetical protein [Gammaproteobacteria bacterium]
MTTWTAGRRDDSLYGGAGNDTFWGGHGSDMIYADAADRIIHGNQPDNFTADGTATPATLADESEEMEGDVDTLLRKRLFSVLRCVQNKGCR